MADRQDLEDLTVLSKALKSQLEFVKAELNEKETEFAKIRADDLKTIEEQQVHIKLLKSQINREENVKARENRLDQRDVEQSENDRATMDWMKNYVDAAMILTSAQPF